MNMSDYVSVHLPLQSLHSEAGELIDALLTHQPQRQTLGQKDTSFCPSCSCQSQGTVSRLPYICHPLMGNNMPVSVMQPL